MIKVWFIVGWAFAIANGTPAGNVSIGQTYPPGTEHEANPKPTSYFENLGPAFETEKECREWVTNHTEISGRASAGCTYVSVVDVKGAAK